MAEEGTPREHQRGQLRTGAVTTRRASPSACAGFRARGFPGVPAGPASPLDGKEGVDGSSPIEGSLSLSAKTPHVSAFSFSRNSVSQASVLNKDGTSVRSSGIAGGSERGR